MYDYGWESAGAPGFGEADADSVLDQVGLVVEVELVHCGGAVVLDGLRAEVQARGDLADGAAIGGELQDLALTGGQGGKGAGGLGGIEASGRNP